MIEAFDGFCSVSLFVDRLERRICSTATFESRRRARGQSGVRAPRCASALPVDTGIEFLEIAEFELALAHLRVPELV